MKGAAYRVIQSKKPLIMELPASLYGRPIKVACFPVFDDDASREQAAAIQEITAQVEEMLSLSEVLEGIAAKL